MKLREMVNDFRKKPGPDTWEVEKEEGTTSGLSYLGRRTKERMSYQTHQGVEGERRRRW